MMDSDTWLILVLGLFVFLFAGEPDLQDALIHSINPPVCQVEEVK